MANLKKVMELLRPGKYAEQFAQEAAQKKWKPGQLTRMIEPPRAQNVDPSFALNHLKEWQEIVKKDPSPENIRRLRNVERDLVGILESAPRSAEEAAAMRHLESFAESDKPRVLTKEQMRKKRAKDQLYKEINAEKEAADKTQLLEPSFKKAAGIGGAIGVGTLATPSAQASEGPAVSQSNPEFTSDVAQSESKDLLSHFEQKYGTYDIPGGVEKLLETVDKYTGRPARAAALSALKGESPVTGAIESVSKDQDVEGRQIARQFLQNLEDRGFRTRAPVDPRLEQLRELGVEIEGKKPEEYLPSNEFPAEGPLGFAADMILDPTNLAGVGLGTKIGKGFSKIRNLVK